MAVGQVTLFPVYLGLFTFYIGALEGRTVRQSADKLATTLLPTLATGTAFWPAVNMVNFLYVPSAWRVLYVNGCGLIWNAYLSYMNST